MKQLQIAIESTTLANGLKVVIAPDTTAPVVTVGVYYKIGFRLEPRGRSGFAHLFEHMMFQGSANAPKMQHIKLINSSGGVLNGSTHYDVTNYYEAVPSNALERVLWLEADRMRALKVDDENLRNQRDVVKEEVRVNVLNQPYGGFPWLDLPPVAFRNWANSHNFYGDFNDLDAADLADVQAFFKTYYVPNNAVLLMLGDVKPEEGFALAKKLYADIPAGAPPPFADPTEPEQAEERRGNVEEKFGTLPAMAIGYVVPKRRTTDWCAMALLDQALHGGRAGKLYRELVLEKQVAVELDGGIDDIFGYNGPTQMVTRILHKPEYSSEQALAAFDEVIREIQEKGISEDELAQLKVKWQSDYFSLLESGHGGMPRYGLMHLLACFTLFDGEPQLVNTVLDGFLSVKREDIQAAAKKYLRSEKRAIVFRTPAVAGADKKGGSVMATRAVEVNDAVPALSAERQVTWPKRKRARLSNGLEVVLVESHTIPKFHGDLYFRSGNVAAIDRGPGLAEMTATVARTGTTKRASRQIEEDLRRIGADLGMSAGSDTSSLSFAGLSEFAEPLLGMVDELARDAAFPEAEFERERRQKLEEVKLEPDGTRIPRWRTAAKSFVWRSSLRAGFAERRASRGVQARRFDLGVSRILHAGEWFASARR